MSALSATQIPKPADEQAFERASVVLFRSLLGDPNVSRHGRRGQRQNGVDLVGIRNGDPVHLVGVQCKLKSAGHELSENEVRSELEKALTFKPELREYFIVTTAPDDANLQQLARELAVEQKTKGRQILIHVWGWNTLEERIGEHADARKAFDPDHNAFSERVLDKVVESQELQLNLQADMAAGMSTIHASLARIEAALPPPPGDATIVANALEAHLDAEIDEYRNLANGGKPRTALPLFERLLKRVERSASGRIQFRLKANIGNCLFSLGEDAKAAQLLSEAYDHAPTEPKAAANKALSLLLQGKWRELLEFGEAALRADPTNDAVAGYLVQAAHFDDAIDEPLTLTPEPIRTSAAVAIGRIAFLRRRHREPEWRRAARDAAAAHPDDSTVRQFAAEAEIEEILCDPRFERTRLLSSDERERILRAADILLAYWDNARSSEAGGRPEHLALCSNLVVAFLALDDLSRAMELARQGLEIAPDDPELVKRALAVAIDSRDDHFARELLPRLAADADAVVLECRFYATQGEWTKLADVCRTKLDQIPEIERTLFKTTVALGELKAKAAIDNLEEKFRAIVADASSDPRASVVAADFAKSLGYENIATEAYEGALKKIDDNSHVAPRLMVAMHAAKRKDWSAAADLLDGHIGEEGDSHELRTLATSIVNDLPIRRRAIRFFERLPQGVAELPFYLHAAGLMHFNRGALRRAEVLLRKAIEGHPEAVNYLALFATLRRLRREDEITPLLEALDLARIEGTPGQKIYLAQVLHRAGQKERAVAYAYETLTLSRNDPDAALRYFGLLMAAPDSRVIPPMNRVAVDAWVRLESADGETFQFIIEEHGRDRPAEGVLTRKHPTAAAAIGLEVGGAFEQKNVIGGSTTWRVAEIKHKYLHALHDIMENFQSRFPETKGIYKISVRQGDIQPALDQVRRASEANREVADLYLIQHFPMAITSVLLGGDPISFAGYIRSLGREIEACLGTDSERFAALDVIQRRRANGAVLDTFTAWTAATMDVLDALAGVFGKLVVPQSAIDELRILQEQEKVPAGRSMTVAFRDGQYFRQELSKEDIDARDRFIDEQIEKIVAACEVVPVAAPDIPTETAALLTQSFASYVLDAANLAAEGSVLLSEDLYYRQAAEAAVAVEGVWLQPVLAFARDQGAISREQYADAVVKLAWRRHGHLALDPETLATILQADDAEALDRFCAVASFIGTKNADMNSHLKVVSTFLERLWCEDGATSNKVMRATSLLLDRLIARGAAEWPLLLAFLKHGADWRLKEYIDAWVTGHFLPRTQLSMAERDIVGLHAALDIRLRKANLSSRALASTYWPL